MRRHRSPLETVLSEELRPSPFFAYRQIVSAQLRVITRGISPIAHSRLRGENTLTLDSQGSTRGAAGRTGLPMFLSLQVIIILLLVAFMFGYGVRACIYPREPLT
jgi:hypothetical protein